MSRLLNLEKAFDEFCSLLGDTRVLASGAATDLYGKSTTQGGVRTVVGALLIERGEEVRGVVAAAQKYGVSLYPISTGKNWGFGSAVPADGESLILDLSRMKSLDILDRELGIILIEPGVTVRQLQKTLRQEGLRFLAPVTGAGPDTSILGNILERGNSATPPSDRFSSLRGLEAVLPDGAMYRSPFFSATLKGGSSYRWGVGPYADGLFGQSNFGIVTRMLIALDPIPERIEVLTGVSVNGMGLAHLTDMIRAATVPLGSVAPLFTLQDGERARARTSSYSSRTRERKSTDLSTDAHEWVVVGTLAGTRSVVRAVRRDLVRKLSPGLTLFFYTAGAERLIRVFGKRLERFLQRRFPRIFMARSQYLIASGGDAERASILPLRKQVALLSVAEAEAIRRNPNFDSDDTCGDIIFAAVLPFRGQAAERMHALATEVCSKYGIDLLFSLSTFSDRTLRVMQHILFDRSDAVAEKAARECYAELSVRCHEVGAHVYRVPVNTMNTLPGDEEFWGFIRRIKEIIDPEDIIAPGRYGRRKIV